MAEGITEIWNITWFCLTLANPQCAALNNKVYAWPDGVPMKYFSERQCVSFAEGHAERWWNENRFKLEYSCEKVKTYEPFVPTRRHSGQPA